MQHKPDPDPTRLEDAGELARRFEQLWRQGDRPRIEDFLQRATPADRPALLDRLLRLDWTLREKAHDNPQLEAYVSRFPAEQEQVRSVWRSWLDRSTNPVDPTRLAVSVADGGAAGFTPPRKLGRYEDLQLIGHGGMGVVFKGFDSRLKRLVAVKMINASILSPEWLGRFKIEAEALARVQHPHIVQVYDWDELDGQPYLVMEYVPGGSLEDRLRQGPLTPMDSARMVALLARAVQHAHDSQVVHRDLKPANVLLAPVLDGDHGSVAGGRPKISDFGLARMTSESNPPIETRNELISADTSVAGRDSQNTQTATGMLLGTPAYVAPEQAAGRARDVGPPVDAWALGVILYRCLSGHLPFDADTKTAMLNAVQFGEPAPLLRWNRNVPVDLEAACIRCLNKEPPRRPLVRELAEMLEAFTRKAPAGAVVSASGPAPRPAPRAPQLRGAVLIEAGPEVSPSPVPRNEAPRPPRSEESDEVRRCPGCGRSVHVSWPRCHDCGTRLMVLKPGFVDDRQEERRESRPARKREADWEPDFRMPDEADKSNYGLILGVLALACGVLGVIPLVSVAGFVFGLIGWLINHEDLRRMKKAKHDPSDQRRVRIGLWCAISGTILSVLGTGGWIAWVWWDW